MILFPEYVKHFKHLSIEEKYQDRLLITGGCPFETRPRDNVSGFTEHIIFFDTDLRVVANANSSLYWIIRPQILFKPDLMSGEMLAWRLKLYDADILVRHDELRYANTEEVLNSYSKDFPWVRDIILFNLDIFV